MRKLMLIPLSLTLAACATTPPAPEIITKTRTVDTACDWAKPIYVSKKDVLTDDTAKQIIAHNEAGAARCGWKPKGK